MNAVPVHQALFWPAASPVSRSGAVDFEALAEGLARADYFGAAQAPFALRATGELRRRFGGREPYSRAQHAVLASRAVESLAVLKMPERRVLAMHAWLAEVRALELNEGPERAESGAKKRLALRLMDLEALADVLARTSCWDRDRTSGPVAGALALDGLLVTVAALDIAERNRLALHALFSELLPGGLGMEAVQAALGAAGLDGHAPQPWVEFLRLVRRMADETVRRDLPSGPGIERTGFPALRARIEPLEARAAARLWLQRYRTLSSAVAAANEKSTTE